MPFYEHGDVRIHYEEIGSGFPLLLIPGGGLNSSISFWTRASFNPMEEIKDDFRDITLETIERYLHNLYRSPADFVFTVTREFVRSCQTPMLILPDDIPAHPYAVAMEIASLAPNAEASIYPWKESKETIRKVVEHA